MGDHLIIDSAKIVGIQDQGRFGYEHYGVGVNGAIDSYAHMMGNVLVGNARFEPSIEITAFNFSMRSTTDIDICVTGAPADVLIGGEPVDTWSTVVLPADQPLTVQNIRQGLRVYIAVRGGMETDVVLGSCTPDSIAKIGSRVSGGQRIPLKQPTGSLNSRATSVASKDIPRYGSTWQIGVCPGPDTETIFKDYFNFFLDQVYTVSPDSNHVGIRLKGTPMEGHRPTEVLSRGAGIGGVEILPTGQPIVLHRGRGVTAGYPIIAVVSSADLGMIGQARPGDAIRFHLVSKKEAIRLYRSQYETILSYEQ